ncbi:MAG: recombinase family protein [Propionibacteriaceae bacterium]|jgi:DNA invertase Pin-like site-specific DNA recombinase|nr:recombinase family protein [Propionibacteriaceae bacterium]
MLIGYARVSTDLQNPTLQTDALTTAGCQRIFTDRASGRLDDRPQLEALRGFARPGDVVVVWRLDRLGRSLAHLIRTMAELRDAGVQFRSLTEAIDTTTPGGELVFHIFGAIAEFESNLISQRTRAGMEAARRRGRTGGRPTSLNPLQRDAIGTMLAQGMTITDVAKTLNTSRATVYRQLEKEGRR